MIRLIFWLLMLVNLLLLAFARWGGDWAGENAGLVVQSPLNADKIRVLPLAAQSAVPASLPLPVSAPVAPLPISFPLPQSAAALPSQILQPVSQPEKMAPVAAKSVSKPAAPQPGVCLEWGEFSGTDLVRANIDLAGLRLGDKLAQRVIELNKGYWVYIPPMRTQAKVNQKLAELKKLGVTEVFVAREGKWKRAISMGVFKTEEAARNFLASLKQKGVKGAQVGERQAKLKLTVFILKSPDGKTRKKLDEWKKDFPDSVLKSTNCN